MLDKISNSSLYSLEKEKKSIRYLSIRQTGKNKLNVRSFYQINKLVNKAVKCQTLSLQIS